MSWEAATRISKALSYEGYVLYPYRQSSLKNQRRWAFGTLYPKAFCREPNDRSRLRVEVVVSGRSPRVRLGARFLHPIERIDGEGAPPWFEALERSFDITIDHIEDFTSESLVRTFSFDGATWYEERVRRRQAAVSGRITCSFETLAPHVHRLRVDWHNTTRLDESTGPASRDDAYLRAFAAAHVLVACQSGELVSALEPQVEQMDFIAGCQNEGVFPVLIGEPGSRTTMLASPIIFYDYPRIAPESHGDFFDATEIDEMLTLRVLTMTDAEKSEARRTDRLARALIERTEQLGDEQILALHGTERTSSKPAPAARSSRLSPGTRVLITPRGGGDALDLVLRGEVATICSVEQDFEGRFHYAVTIDADPGRDLGEAGQPGHRFFFYEEELEVAP